jgi:competence protein ComEA
VKKLLFLILFAFLGPVFATVNINTATQAELETLQGVGPVKAKAIVEHRKRNGPFRSADDLEKVSGIGPATMKRVRKDITVGSGTHPAKKESKSAPR